MTPLVVETLAIGDELLTGKIADTNSAFVGAQCFRAGVRLSRTQTVADDPFAIRAAIGEAAQRADIVVCFGGLGPTSDDKTSATIAELLGVGQQSDAAAVAKIRKRCAEMGREVTPARLKQALVPRGATVLANPAGYAPGFMCRIGRADFFFLPGVPFEMRPMFEQSVLGTLEKRCATLGVRKLLSRTWRCIGIAEADLQQRMDSVEGALPPGAYLGYRTRLPENHLTLYFPDAPEFEAWCARIASLLADWTFSVDEEEIESVVVASLRLAGKSLALAESCTGGLVAERLTSVPGSSDVFWGAGVVYQVAAKAVLAGVQLQDPQQAVSAHCSRALALGVLKSSGCALAAGVTGYMGPGGGTQTDPVGTYYICVVSAQGEFSERIYLPGMDRSRTRWAASTHLLNAIRLFLAQQARAR